MGRSMIGRRVTPPQAGCLNPLEDLNSLPRRGLFTDVIAEAQPNRAEEALQFTVARATFEYSLSMPVELNAVVTK